MDINNIQKTIAEKNAEVKRYDISVSQVIDALKVPFNSEAKAREMFEKYYNNPRNRYYMMKPEAIMAQWEKSGEVGRALGRAVDGYSEIYFAENFNQRQKELAFRKWQLDYNYDNDPVLKSCVTGFNQFMQHGTKWGLTLVGREIDLYYQTPSGITLKGRCDGLFLNNKGELMLIDYKTNKELSMVADKVTEFFKPPFNEHKSSDYNSYTLQLYFYKAALVHTYNICPAENIRPTILWLHREEDKPRGMYYSAMWPSEKIPFNIVTLNRAIEAAHERRQLEKELLSYGK